MEDPGLSFGLSDPEPSISIRSSQPEQNFKVCMGLPEAMSCPMMLMLLASVYKGETGPEE